MIMIQNNWHVAADGPVQVTSMSFRWFFLLFVIMVPFIMISVLVGAIIDSLSSARAELVKEATGQMDPLEGPF